MSLLPLFTAVLVAGTLTSAALVGSAVLRALRATPEPVDRLLFALPLGLGVFATLLLVLSALGALHPAALWAAVLVPGVTSIRERGALAEGLSALRSLLAAAEPVERIALAVVGLAVLLILGLGALGPVFDWDSLMYHLQLPRLFLEVGRLHVPADSPMHFAFLGLFQFLYLPFLAVGATAGAALLNAAMAALLALALIVAGSRLFERSVGLFAGVALWGSSAILIVAMTPRVDVTLVTVLFLAQYAVLLALRTDARWGVAVAALLGGMAVGIKYHAGPYLVGLAPFVVVALWKQSRGDRSQVATRLAVTAALALVAVAPWMLKNQLGVGAPLFPFFTEPRVPAFIADITGSTARPSSVPAGAYSALGRAREPISLEALLFRPAALTVEGEAGAYSRNPLFYLMPLVLLCIRDLRILALMVPVAVYLGVTLGYFGHTNLRYLLPALPASILALGAVLTAGAARLPASRALRAALIVAAALVTLPALRMAGPRALTPLRVEIAVGLEPPEALLNGDVQFVVAQWFAEQTPADAKLLMLFDARGFYHRRAVLQDNLLQNWALLVGSGATERCLEGTGITHVFVNRAILGYYQARGVDPNSLLWDRFPQFAAHCLQPMVNTNGIEIYRVVMR